jgi:hypothetical protein
MLTHQPQGVRLRLARVHDERLAQAVGEEHLLHEHRRLHRQGCGVALAVVVQSALAHGNHFFVPLERLHPGGHGRAPLRRAEWVDAEGAEDEVVFYVLLCGVKGRQAAPDRDARLCVVL